MNCQKCNSPRIISVCSKVSDGFGAICEANNNDYDGYVPDDLGIGGGDYICFKYCIACGKIQGKFPLEKANIEIIITDDDIREFYRLNFATLSYHMIRDLSYTIDLIKTEARKFDDGNKMYSFINNFWNKKYNLTQPMISEDDFLLMYKNDEANIINLQELKEMQ